MGGLHCKTTVRSQRQKSHVDVHNRVLSICPGIVVQCYCVSVIQIKSIYIANTMNSDFQFWKYFLCGTVFTLESYVEKHFFIYFNNVSDLIRCRDGFGMNM